MVVLLKICLVLGCLLGSLFVSTALVVPSSRSRLLGRSLWTNDDTFDKPTTATRRAFGGPRSYLEMRKQKSSDKRTRRRQRGLVESENDNLVQTTSVNTLTTTPMQQRGQWKEKANPRAAPSSAATVVSGGRGRSRKRSNLYSSLSFYYNKFLSLLTQEYKTEENEVIRRIEASVDDPVVLEIAGYALYDMYPTRRGNLFTDEVYRLAKASDSTSFYSQQRGNVVNNTATDVDKTTSSPELPANHKFSINDVIVVTRQPQGSGDIFDPAALPISETAQKMEARVLGVGPTYLDIAVGSGTFEATFGRPAPNDISGKGDRRLRVRVDRFFSPIPYQRMVTALAQISRVPSSSELSATPSIKTTNGESDGTAKSPLDRISMDELLRELVIGTHAIGDVASPFWKDPSACNLDELSNRISKPPMGSSNRLAAQVLKHIQSNPQTFGPLNSPQLAAVQASLTRRCTLIQGPPGTGKTTVASSIGFGFVHQCRSLSPHTKVLACAFSNVGADNLAEALLRLGLKVVRVGKPSAVTPSLWNYTIDAAIDRDPDAQKALETAAKATATLARMKRSRSTTGGEGRLLQQTATLAVKASTKSCNLAATRAFREADVIVSTSMGAADSRLMAACGLNQDSGDDDCEKGPSASLPMMSRTLAPDGLPPLSMPFVIVDEACQSVEPASLIPVVSSNSCRSLVLLGDPCQLPPTVRHAKTDQSPLSTSLMERLACLLPSPAIKSKPDTNIYDTSFLGSSAIQKARAVLDKPMQSYRNQFKGAHLLSVQFRMHPSIAAFPSAIFYGGLLSTPRQMANSRPIPHPLKGLLPCKSRDTNVRLVHIGGRCNERHGTPNRHSLPTEENTSYANTEEAECVARILGEALSLDGTEDLKSIAVISPYNGQVQLINNEMSNVNMPEGVTVEVKSVDAFQGRERDLVIFSAVRSNRDGRIGFLNDWRRLNVALTRAKKGLIVVGDFDTLAPADSNWAAFWKWANMAGCVVDTSKSL